MNAQIVDVIRRLASGESIDTNRVDAQMKEALVNLGLDTVDEAGVLRLKAPVELLSGESILAGLGHETRDIIKGIDVHFSLDSTNDFLLKKMPSGNGHGYICLAEKQTAGKGRRGRHWISPFGCHLYMSIGWEMPKGAGGMPPLSLVAGIEAAATLQELGIEGVGLKWPNDLLCQAGKLGGILVEAVQTGSQWGFVLGLGINFEAGLSHLATLDQRPGYVPRNSGVGRNKLAAALIDALVQALACWPQQGFAAYQARWERFNLYLGEEVVVTRGEAVFTGIDRGVDDEGNLLLEVQGQEMVFSSGEVSLRPAIPLR